MLQVYEIVVEDEFSAAHFLKLYDGSWEHRHGHNWKVAVTARSEGLDSIGVVTDFEILKPALKKVLSEFNAISLNDHPDFKDKLNTSTENVARMIYERLRKAVSLDNAKIIKVTVWETPDARASYIKE